MLRRLSLRNFILIHELSLDFNEGFTAITGETGSGKSILLSALGLIRGDRADFSNIGPYDARSTVEAVFENNPELSHWLTENSFESWDELIIRREISSDGRSRTFINDTPSSLQDLKLLGERLFIIHSQYHTLELKNQAYQRYILDALAGTESSYQEFIHTYTSYLKRKSGLEIKQNEIKDLESKLDYEQFILSEIQPLNLHEVSYEELTVQLAQLEYRQSLHDDLNHLISLSEGPVASELTSLNSRINRATENDGSFDEIKTRLKELLSNLTEIGFLCHQKIATDDSNSLDEKSLLNQVDEFNRILNKHRLTSQEGLIALQETLEGRLDEIRNKVNWISTEEKELQFMESSLIALANKLNEQREKALPSITQSIQEGLNLLKLSGALLKFNLERTLSLNDRGMMNLSILFSANQGMDPVPIEKAASGGELSRVMLLLQQLISTKLHLPSIFFDEIDAGVSGDIAQRMGKLLRNMGEGRQLFAITHLPQVAAIAAHHFEVKKQEIEGKTQTLVVPLTTEQRIFEVARLMSGEEVNEGAILNAKKLMGIS